MKVKKSLGIIIALTVFIALIVVVSGFSEDPFTMLGKFYMDNIEGKTDDSKVIAVVGDKNITQQSVDIYKESYEIVGAEKSEEEIIEKIATDILMTKEAEKNNITVKDEEVRKTIDYQLGLMKEDTTTYQGFQNYLKGANMTEEEYVELTTPIYKRLMMKGVFKYKILKPEFEKSTNLSEEKFHNEFEDYCKEYEEELLDHAQIKYLKDDE